MNADHIRRQAIDARRDELLTVGEFAHVMKLSEKTIYRRIWAGTQRGAVRDGWQWRIDLAIALDTTVRRN